MRLHHIVVVCASLLLSSVSARAQAPADPTGHWEGSLDAHGTDVAFQVDFAKNPAGGFIGSISIPGQRLKGLPLTKIDLDGRTITFGARSDQLMIATISPDNASMTGDFSSSAFTGAFVLTRAGGPQVASAPRSAAIGKELEGRWTGVLDVDGGLHLVLTLANQADGTSIASLVNVDEGGVMIPLTVTADGPQVTLTTTTIDGRFAGTLRATGTELAGTFTQGALSAPLTFRRQP